MKRNFLLALTCGCALASWSAEPSATVNDDIKLKPAVTKTLPNGAQIDEIPAYTPVGGNEAMRKAPKYGYRMDSLVCVKPDGTFTSKQLFEYTEAGKIAKQTDYLYNASTKQWTMSNTYLWGWNDKGYMTFDEQVASNGNSVRNEYKYNAQNLGIEKVTLRRTGFDGEYVNYSKGEYDYDDRGNMTKENTYKWTNNEWTPSSRATAAYDENNYRSAYEEWRYKNGIWTGYEKKEYKTNKLGLQTYILNYSWERKNKGVFEPFAKVTNVFSEKDNKSLMMQTYEYYNIDTNDWLGNFKDRGGAQRNNLRGIHERDERLRDKLSYSETLYGKEWRRGSYSTYEYKDNADGSYECVKKNYTRPDTVDTYNHNETVTTRVDAAGHTTYFYDNYHRDVKRSTEWNETFDSKGNCTGREDYRYDANNNKIFSIKSVNKHDAWGNIIDTYNWTGKKNDKGIADSWIESSHFTYTYEQNGTVRTDKRRYKYVPASDSWANDFGDGADFDFTVKKDEIMVPVGYTADYMQTAKYSYKGKGEDWETTKYTYYYSKVKDNGVENVTIGDNTVTFGNNILRVNGGTNIDNSVYSTDGKLVFRGNNAQEDLGNLGNGLYIVRSIVDGKVHSLKVIVK